MFHRRSLALAAASGLLIACAIWLVVGMAFDGFDLVSCVVALLAVLLAWVVWVVPRYRAEDDEETPVALVLLLSQPRYLDTAIVARLAGAAWRTTLTPRYDAPDDSGRPPWEEPREEAFVMGDSPQFLISYGPFVFVVNNCDSPYFDHPRLAAQEVEELRTRKAILEHEAWISIDLLAAAGPHTKRRDPAALATTLQTAERKSIEDAYRHMAALAAELLDDDCLAVCCPGERLIHVCDGGTSDRLQSPQPIKALERSGSPPVVAVCDDDPKMKQAVGEARRRFEEFVTAFENRIEGQLFSVKAPMRDGRSTEFMWLEVTAIENGIIYGVLDNEPVELQTVALGDRVRVRVSDLHDWIYTDGQKSSGGFTVALLRKMRDGS